MSYDLRSGRLGPTDSAMATPVNNGVPPSVDESRPLNLADLRSTLRELRSDIFAELRSVIDAAISPLSAALDTVRTTVEDQGRRLLDYEQDLSGYSDRIVELEGVVARLNTGHQEMSDKLDDLESRSRRNNLRIVGIPEGTEGSDPVQFMSGFFSEVLPDVFSKAPKLDRAHRLGPPRTGGSGSARSRVFIVCFHNFREKERALRRQPRGLLKFREHDVSIYPDYTSAVAKKRASFLNVKHSLWERKVKFNLAFPARLFVDHAGERLRFDSSSDAQSWFDSHF